MEDMRNGACALCGHRVVVECTPVSRGYKSAYNPVVAAAVDPGFFSPMEEVGRIRIYACRKCGFAQTFVLDPRSVPIGAQHGTKLIKKSRDPE